MDVGGDGLEDSVRQVLQVDDGDVNPSLDFRVSKSLFRRNVVGEIAVRQTGESLRALRCRCFDVVLQTS